MTDPRTAPPWHFAYSVERADWVAIETLHAFSSNARRKADIGVLIASGVMGGLLLALVAGPLLPAWLDVRVALIPVALGLWGLCALAVRGITHVIARRRAQSRLVGSSVEINVFRDHIDLGEDQRRSTYRWPSLCQVVQTPSHVFLCLLDDRIITLPLRLFKDGHDMQSFGFWAESQMTDDDWDS